MMNSDFNAPWLRATFPCSEACAKHIPEVCYEPHRHTSQTSCSDSCWEHKWKPWDFKIGQLRQLLALLPASHILLPLELQELPCLKNICEIWWVQTLSASLEQVRAEPSSLNYLKGMKQRSCNKHQQATYTRRRTQLLSEYHLEAAAALASHEVSNKLHFSGSYHSMIWSPKARNVQKQGQVTLEVPSLKGKVQVTSKVSRALQSAVLMKQRRLMVEGVVHSTWFPCDVATEAMSQCPWNMSFVHSFRSLLLHVSFPQPCANWLPCVHKTSSQTERCAEACLPSSHLQYELKWHSRLESFCVFALLGNACSVMLCAQNCLFAAAGGFTTSPLDLHELECLEDIHQQTQMPRRPGTGMDRWYE